MATALNTTITPTAAQAVDRSAGLFAHYFNNKTVRITDSMRPIDGEVIQVAGKREARKIAAERNARCGNV